MIISNRFIFLLLFCAFFFQQFTLFEFGTLVKPWVLITVISFLAIFVFVPRISLSFPSYLYIVSAFFLFIVVSSFWAEDLSIAFVRALGVVLLCVSYLLLKVFYDNSEKKEISQIIYKLSYFYLIMSLMYYLIGFYLFKTGSGYLTDDAHRGLYGLYVEGVLPRMRGFSDSPNNLVLLLIPMFYIPFILKVKACNIYYLLILIVLALTFSITGYIIFILASVFILFTQSMRVLLQLSLVIFFFLFLIFILYLSYENFAFIVDSRIDRISTGSGRYELFNYAINLIVESPISGYGLGQARLFLGNVGGRGYESTHNSFIEILFEGGFVAGGLFVLSWFSIFYYAVKLEVSRKDRVNLCCYLVSLFLISSANLMVYVELMVFNFFCFFFVCEELKVNKYKLYVHY